MPGDIHTQYEAILKRLERETIVPKNYMQSSEVERNQQFFLDRTQQFADRIGNPERQFKTIHIAGTSGKGSTTTMIYESLRADGYHVGTYRSPYVTTAVENIEADGMLISAEDFIRITEQLLEVRAEVAKKDPVMAPSYAEIFFLIGLVYFAEIGVEWLVLETGAGGRFDMTNITPSPIVVGLTPIGMDHVELLGDTLENIASHKAGIIKPGARVFSSETKPQVQAVFDAEAAQYGSAVHYVPPSAQPAAKPKMFGKHQEHNAALATAICRAVGVSEEAIATGVQLAKLPARTELMQHSPRVLLDGAHSEPKMLALREVLEHNFTPWNRCIFVFAAKEGKHADDMIAPIADLPDSLILTHYDLPGFSAYEPEQMRDEWQHVRSNLPIAIERDPIKAVETALAQAEPDDLIVITGSLYLAGFAREYWIPRKRIVEERTVFPKGL